MLFNESQSRIVISVTPEILDKAIAMLREREFHFSSWAKSAATSYKSGQRTNLSVAIADLYDDWWNAIRRAVEEDESIPSL